MYYVKFICYYNLKTTLSETILVNSKLENSAHSSLAV